MKAACSILLLLIGSFNILEIYPFKDSDLAMFILQNGGCLKGPLYFTDKAGKKIFELPENTDYPTDCSKGK